VKGEHLNFDEESHELYDSVAPTLPESHFQEVLARLEPKLPGEGALLQRYENWRRAFVIPNEKLGRGISGRDQGLPRTHPLAYQAAAE